MSHEENVARIRAVHAALEELAKTWFTLGAPQYHCIGIVRHQN